MEISARRDDHSPVLTRTIGDPLTGTDAITPTTPNDMSPCQEEFDLPALPAPAATNGNGRPQFLQLPAPQEFSTEPTVVDPSSPVSPTSTLVRDVVQSPGTPSPTDSALRVLVVDDDPLTRRLMSRMLSRLGCRVSTAENGEIALELILGMRTRATPTSEETGSAGLTAEGAGGGAHEYKYGVIFLDNQMPVMSGLETVAKLRELGRRDLVVGVTGECSISAVEREREAVERC